MKKFLLSLSLLLMAAALSVPVIASESAPIRKIDASSAEAVELTLIARELTPDGRVDVYSFHLPGDGAYCELPDFRAEYAEGAHVTVQGTWDPTYARLNVMLKEREFGTSVYSYAGCNEPTVYGLWHDSEWDCFLKADGKELSGTITVEVT